MKLSVHSPSAEVKFLNPTVLKSGSEASKELQKVAGELRKIPATDIIKEKKVAASGDEKQRIEVHLTVGENAIDGMVALLLAQDSTPDKKVSVTVTAQVDGQDAKVSTEYQEGKSQWYKVAITEGKHLVTFLVAPSKDSLTWSGKATAWFVSRQKQNSKMIELTLNQAPAERVLPPTVWPAGEVRKSIRLGEASFITKGAKN
jgi:hypothetical protein